MLVLSRKIGEQIVLGDSNDVVITVVSIGGDEVRLGIETSPRIEICRKEVHARPKAERTDCQQEEPEVLDSS